MLKAMITILPFYRLQFDKLVLYRFEYGDWRDQLSTLEEWRLQ